VRCHQVWVIGAHPRQRVGHPLDLCSSLPSVSLAAPKWRTLEWIVGHHVLQVCEHVSGLFYEGDTQRRTEVARVAGPDRHLAYATASLAVAQGIPERIWWRERDLNV
jgi:hypothetical protein